MILNISNTAKVYYLEVQPSYLWLVSIIIQNHAPVRAVVTVTQAELLHEDLVLTVLSTLDDQSLHQLLLTQIHLQPLIDKRLGLREQGPPGPARQESSVLWYPAPIGVRRCSDLVVGDQTRYHAQHARAWVL